jgi:hypothetical protein
VRTTVQLLVPGAVTVAGAQVKLPTWTKGVIVVAAERVTPAALTVTVTEVFAATVPALAAKVAVVTPAGTVTDAGTVKAGLLLDAAAANPPAPAAFVSDTVQVAVPPEAIVPGLHARPESAGGVMTASEKVFEAPFRLAVSTAVASAVTLPTLAGKLALVAPAATVTDAGTVTAP